MKSRGGRVKLLSDMKLSIKIPALKAHVENAVSVKELYKQVLRNAGGKAQLNTAAIAKIKEYKVLEVETSKRILDWTVQAELVELIINILKSFKGETKKITDSLLETILNNGLVQKFRSELKELITKQLLFKSLNPYLTPEDFGDKTVLEQSAATILHTEEDSINDLPLDEEVEDLDLNKKNKSANNIFF